MGRPRGSKTKMNNSGGNREVTLPFNYIPRDYQISFLSAMDSGIKRALLIWHRRSGKDKTALNFTIRQMWERIGTYYYLFPTFTEGRRILWDGIDNNGFAFRSHFPSELMATRPNETEMQINFTNGSVFQIIGTDKYDRIRGTNPVGCVFSEFSYQNPGAWDLVAPILLANGGWAIFCFTPNGQNHGYKLFKAVEGLDDWFTEILTVNDTKDEKRKPIITQVDLEAEKKRGVPEEFIKQEYYCDFNAGGEGSYYGRLLAELETKGQIVNVPFDPRLPVHTAWDLGVSDSTAIWFYQRGPHEFRFIDYYETNGEGLDHYVRVLQRKRDDLRYIYGTHIAPHDIEVQDLSTGKTRKEWAAGLGLDFEVSPKLPIIEGIQAARAVLPRCWFDKENCRRGLSALLNYRKEFDHDKMQFRDRPLHDWSSNGADAFRYFAVGFDEIINNQEERKSELDFSIFGERRADL